MKRFILLLSLLTLLPVASHASDNGMISKKVNLALKLRWIAWKMFYVKKE